MGQWFSMPLKVVWAPSEAVRKPRARTLEGWRLNLVLLRILSIDRLIIYV